VGIRFNDATQDYPKLPRNVRRKHVDASPRASFDWPSEVVKADYIGLVAVKGEEKSAEAKVGTIGTTAVQQEDVFPMLAITKLLHMPRQERIQHEWDKDKRDQQELSNHTKEEHTELAATAGVNKRS
jgi:hypothetical protein